MSLLIRSQCYARKILPISLEQTRTDQLFKEKLNLINTICKDNAHPNIVDVFDCGSLDSYYFIDMELSDINLKDYMTSKTNIQGLMDWEEALDHGHRVFLIIAILQQLLSGLQFIHSNRGVHGDLNPQNGMAPLKPS
jgi:serine/threonine protein kinase